MNQSPDSDVCADGPTPAASTDRPTCNDGGKEYRQQCHQFHSPSALHAWL